MQSEAKYDPADIWDRYHNQPTDDLRNQLIELYMPLVRSVARRIHQKLPKEVALDDLVSAGVFGLMFAIPAFDAERNIKFETYAAPRVRGAILDELRSWDILPRLARRRAQALHNATAELEARLGHTPTADELAKHLEITPAQVRKYSAVAQSAGTVSLSQSTPGDEGRGSTRLEQLMDDRNPTPDNRMHDLDVKSLVTRGLTRAEKLIVTLYYFEQMSMKEIGLTLELSESRVSQMHASILRRLKARLTERSGAIAA